MFMEERRKEIAEAIEKNGKISVFEITEKQRKNFGEFGQSSLHGTKNVV